jgi:hypothetical protein
MFQRNIREMLTYLLRNHKPDYHHTQKMWTYAKQKAKNFILHVQQVPVGYLLNSEYIIMSINDILSVDKTRLFFVHWLYDLSTWFHFYQSSFPATI